MKKRINLAGIRKRLSKAFRGGFIPEHISSRAAHRAFSWRQPPFEYDVFQLGALLFYRANLAAERREAKTPRRS